MPRFKQPTVARCISKKSAGCQIRQAKILVWHAVSADCTLQNADPTGVVVSPLLLAAFDSAGKI